MSGNLKVFKTLMCIITMLMCMKKPLLLLNHMSNINVLQDNLYGDTKTKMSMIISLRPRIMKITIKTNLNY